MKLTSGALGFILCFSFSLSIGASEVDQFRLRYAPLEDSKEIIDQKFNAYFQAALNEANEHELACSEDELYEQLRDRFRNHYFDEFTKWLTDTEEVDTIATKVTESIYKDFNVFQSPVQGGFARVIQDPTGRVLKYNSIKVGTDKFEHMLGSGFKYFEKHYLEEDPIEKALRIGWRAETGLMGGFMTGVMSYADMAANFQGMRFWNHVLQKNEDIFGQNLGPYVACQNHIWVQLKKIELDPYIDWALDEALNCSKFRTPKMLVDVLNRLEDYERQDQEGRSFSCPLEPQKIWAMQEKYGPKLSEWLINADGHYHMKSDLRRPDK